MHCADNERQEIGARVHAVVSEVDEHRRLRAVWRMEANHQRHRVVIDKTIVVDDDWRRASRRPASLLS